MYQIDRSPDGFERILEFLCSGSLSLHGLPPDTLAVVADNLTYFHIAQPNHNSLGMVSVSNGLIWRTPQVAEVAHMSLSEDRCSVTKSAGGGAWNACIRSQDPVDRFTVRVDALGIHKNAMVCEY